MEHKRKLQQNLSDLKFEANHKNGYIKNLVETRESMIMPTTVLQLELAEVNTFHYFLFLKNISVYVSCDTRHKIQ